MNYETARAYHDPSVHQFSVFLENRVGMLRKLIDLLQAGEVRLLGLSILDTADSAIVRFVVDDSDRCRQILHGAAFAFTECEIVAVELSDSSSGLLRVCATLLEAEINLHYAYLIQRAHHAATLALHVDDRVMAVRALKHRNFTLLDQSDIAG